MVLILICIVLFNVLPAAEASDAHPEYGKIELAFEPNQGQAGPGVKFLTRGNRAGVLLKANEAVLQVGGPKAVSVAMRFPGHKRNPKVQGIDQLPGTTNYLVGSMKGSARTGIPHFRKVQYSDVYPGIDVVYYGNNRQLEYDFIVKPGADPGRIRVTFAGSRGMSISSDGDLIVETDSEPIIQKKPVVYQEVDGRRKAVEASYVLSKKEVRFKLGEYDETKALIIDPVIVFSTYFGGTGTGDQPYAIAVDAAGSVYIAGFTNSTDFPITGGVQGNNGGGQIDAFVFKLDPKGTQILYSTYIGGSSTDEAHSLAVDPQGNVYIAGFTTSTNFPIVNGFQTARAGGQDAYFLKLNSAGNAIVFSSYLGGTADDRPFGLALDKANNIYIAGSTASSNFPTESAYQRQSAGGFADIFVTKVGASGNLVYSTYVGGFGNDQPLGIAVDGNGAAYVTGFTTSLNFPVVNAVQIGYGGNPDDGFVFKLSANGTALDYSTFLGGIGSDTGVRIAVDGEGGAYITGMTSSVNFPTRNAYQFLPAGDADAFVTRLSPDGKTLVFSTFFGGFQTDSGTGIALDRSGAVYISGFTTSFDLPTANQIQNFIGGDRDAFIAKFMPDGNTTIFSTFLGGLDADAAVSMAVDADENIYVTGLTSSANFPTMTPVQPSIAKGQDVFVTKIDARDIVASSQFQIAPLGGSSVTTRGTRTDAVFGYALAEPATGPGIPGSAALTGLAIVDSRQNGALATEVAVLAPKAIHIGRLFVEVTNQSRSVISIANASDEEASVDFVFTDEAGTSSNFANVKIAPHQHFSRFVTDDPLSIFTSGTLNFSSDIPVTATAFRTFSNEAGDFLLSLTPITNPLEVTAQPVTIPELAEGAGWNTEVILVNTTEEQMNGEVQFLSQGSASEPGAPLEVSLGDGTTSASVLEFDIPARSFRRVATAGIASRSEVAFAGVEGFSFRTPGTGGIQITGATVAEAADADARLTGLEILEFRQLGITQSHVALAAPPLRRTGTLFVENTEQVRTMISIVNPSLEEEAVIEFMLTDESGTQGEPVTITVTTSGQATNFLSEAPFSLGAGAARTLRFSSSVPVFVNGLRFFTNERNDSVQSAIPVAAENAAVDQKIVVPHFANGGGWTTELVLVNTSPETVTGEVQFLSQGIGEPVRGITVGTGIGTATVFEYEIPARGYRRIKTNGLVVSVNAETGVEESVQAPLEAGSIHIISFSGAAAPHAHAVIGQRIGANTVLQTAIEGQLPKSSLRMYAEASGDFEGAKQRSTHTAIALANPFLDPVTVVLSLKALDGRPLGTSRPIEITGHGQTAMFLHQVPGFESVKPPFQGVLTVTVTGGPGVTATALRAMLNERLDFLATTTGPLHEDAGLPGRVVFPYTTDGTGYAAQLILINSPGVQGLSGVMRFLAPDGSALPIDVLRLGSVRIMPFLGSNTPHAHAILTRRDQGVVVFQTFVEGQLPAASFRFYAEAIGDFDSGVNGSTRSAIAIANPSAVPATVRLDLTGFNGERVASAQPLVIPAYGEVATFIHHIPGLEGVPRPFQGVLRLTTESGAGVTAVGMRAIYNERGNALFTTTGPLVNDAGLPGKLVFPHIAEGGGYTTQFIVISSPFGGGSAGRLSFFNQQGNPLSVTLVPK